MIRRLLSLLLLLVAAPALAEGFGGAPHITPALVAESLTPAAGKPTTLAFSMHPAAQWHGYWKNPGDAGMETLTTWSGPKGMSFGPLQYPVPQTLLIAGLMNHVYEADYAELVTVQVPAGLAKGTKLPITVKLDWLACNPSTCVPETANLSIELTVGDGAPDPAHAADFDTWRKALPKPLGSPAHFQIANGRFRIELPLPAAVKADQPHLFLATDKIIDYAAPQTVSRDGDRIVIETAAKPDAKADKVEGVLKLADGNGLSFEATPGKVAAAAAGGATVAFDPHHSSGEDEATLLWALGGAILGGLILNIMPCVFPVLSIKALSLAKGGRTEPEARAEALAYTAGTVLVCAALGAVLLALKSAGQSAGWAFQLQDVRVIIFLLLLVIAIALNLAGLFELPAITGGSGLAAKGGALGAFWTGALAAFIATPCSGPFMGTALGVALLLPPWSSMAIFAGLGFGLALPFLALGFIPAFRRALPKPGGWTDQLRRGLSLPMFATALGLAWIAGRQAGVDVMAMGLGAAMIVGLALWRVGRRQYRLNRYPYWPLIPMVAIVAAILIAVPGQISNPAIAAKPEAGHERFDDARLAALRAEGRPVLLYFTADWCLTCKVNEKAAIERDEVTSAFAKKRVVVMVGDWTNGDPAISKFLSQHGRSGVPFYLFYPAGGGEPKELPQILTPGLLAGLA